jgi:hypothetical protein
VKLADIIATAHDVARIHGKYGPPNNQAAALAIAILALLGNDECGWEPDMVVRLDMAHPSKAYVSVERNNLNVDEARWAALEILKAAEVAEEQADG